MSADIHPLLLAFQLDERRLGPSVAYARSAVGRLILVIMMSRMAFSAVLGALDAAPSRPLQPALDRYILPAIGLEALSDDSRKLVGRYLRQLLEHCGYEWVRSDVPLTVPATSRTGSIYRKKGAAVRETLTEVERHDWAVRRIAELQQEIEELRKRLPPAA